MTVWKTGAALAAALCILLAGCSAPPPGGEDGDPAETPFLEGAGDGETPPQEEPVTEESPDPIREPFDTAVLDGDQLELFLEMEEIVSKRGLNPVRQDKLEEMGITVSLQNIGITPEQLDHYKRVELAQNEEAGETPPTVEFAMDLVLTTSGGATRTVPVEGTLVNYTSNVANLRPVWGSISIVDGNTIALNTQTRSRLLDADTLEGTGFSLDFASLEGREYSVHDVYRHPQLGYLSAGYVDGESCILLFDERGALRSVNTLNHTGEYQVDFSPVNYFNYFRYLEILDLDVPTIYATDKGFSFSNHLFVSLDDFSSAWYISTVRIYDGGEQFYYEDGDRRAQVFHAFQDEESPEGAEQTQFIAMLYQGDALTKYVRFVSLAPRYEFGDHFGDDDPYSSTMTLEGGRFVVRSDFSGQTLTVDFDQGTGHMDYTISPEDIKDVLETSPSGRYQLVTANYTGMGDAYWESLALYDTQEREIVGYIGQVGSSTILSPAAFLDDETLYFKPNITKIIFYATDGLSVTRQVELSAGEDEARVNFNVLYDGEGDRFFVAYIDDFQKDEYGWEDFEDSTYRVAVFDGQGEQMTTFGTEIPGNNGPLYHYHCPAMSLEGDVLLIDGSPVTIP